jgi:MurNAc alpha-1-phosphate uridylyltransferase
MTNSAMIFAAGRGTRMKALTQSMPKPLIEVAGKPLIDHALALLDHSPIQNRIVNTHYLGHMVVQHLVGKNVTISPENDLLLETGGGLKHALNLLQSPDVLTLNSDAVWAGENPVNALLSAWDPKRMDALLMLVARPNAIGHKGSGDFLLDEDGRLTRGAGLVYSGCQIIKTAAVSEISEDVFSLNVVWDRLLAKKSVFGMVHDGKICDVGHPEGIALAQDMLGYHDV